MHAVCPPGWQLNINLKKKRERKKREKWGWGREKGKPLRQGVESVYKENQMGGISLFPPFPVTSAESSK